MPQPGKFPYYRALDECAELLIRHGGHAQAAGFSLLNDNIEALRERLTQIAAREMSEADLVPVLAIDAEVRLTDVTVDLIEELKRLEPTGHGSPQPVLCARRLRVIEKRVIGGGGDHLKMRLSDADCEIEAIAFRWGKYAEILPDRVNVAFQPEINEWQGQKRLQLNIHDIQPAG